MSALNSELGRLRREKADVEEQLRQMQKGVIPPETANLVDNLEREKTDWKHKYTHLRDRYDVSLYIVCINSVCHCQAKKVCFTEISSYRMGIGDDLKGRGKQNSS